jgi:hypothetical protein
MTSVLFLVGFVLFLVGRFADRFALAGRRLADQFAAGVPRPARGLLGLWLDPLGQDSRIEPPQVCRVEHDYLAFMHYSIHVCILAFIQVR